MRSFSASLQTEIEAGRVCRAVKLTRADGSIEAATDHDKALMISGTSYSPMPGNWSAPLRSNVGAGVDNLTFSGTWGQVVEQDIIDGLYDGASIELLIVGWQLSPPQAGMIWKGTLGKVSWNRDGWSANIVDLMQQLAQPLGGTFGPGCPHILGDTRCKVNLATYQVAGTVTAVSSVRTTFQDTSRTEAADWFTDGEVTFTSGANAGKTYPIDAYAADGTVTLQLPALADITVGDAYTMTPGCNHMADGSYIESITIDAVGSGYPPNATAPLTITGDGKDASGYAQFDSGGAVSKVVLTGSGTGYASAAVSLNNVAGGGAAFTAVLSAGGDCQGKFANRANFGGWPFLRGETEVAQASGISGSTLV